MLFRSIIPVVLKELYDAAVETGATVLPGVSTDGYTYDDSEEMCIRDRPCGKGER